MPELTEVRLGPGRLGLTISGQPAVLPIAADRWLRGLIPGSPPVAFACRGAWTPEGRFEAELRMIETPHAAYLALDPASRQFTLTWREPTLHSRDLTGYRA
jgi:hypothetical protein